MVGEPPLLRAGLMVQNGCSGLRAVVFAAIVSGVSEGARGHCVAMHCEVTGRNADEAQSVQSGVGRIEVMKTH